MFKTSIAIVLLLLAAAGAAAQEMPAEYQGAAVDQTGPRRR